MDLTHVYWKAIHSDKVIESKTDRAYALVKRATLQKLVFYSDDNTIQEFKRPANVDKWAIRWRLRTRVDPNGSQVKERHWVIDDGKFNLLNEQLEFSTHNSCTDCERKPVTETPNDFL